MFIQTGMDLNKYYKGVKEIMLNVDYDASKHYQYL